jgi:hypothetical protein
MEVTLGEWEEKEEKDSALLNEPKMKLVTAAKQKQQDQEGAAGSCRQQSYHINSTNNACLMSR